MTKTTEEGPYRIEDAWSGSFKKGKVVGPSLSKEDIFPGTPETLCDMLNAAWLAGRSSATAVPLSPEMVERIVQVVLKWVYKSGEIDYNLITSLLPEEKECGETKYVADLRTRLLGIR